MLRYLRFLAGRERTREANRHLGMTLAFTAGAINAGGFLAVRRYTSHMTGVLSSIADDVVLHRGRAAAGGIAAFVAFVAGAAVCAQLINWARRRRLHSEFALALVVEALLLLVFGILGSRLDPSRALVPATVLMLCFTMGLQNAMITKISGAEIRTTHMTGNATDLGIELGKLFYRNSGSGERVVADRQKLAIHASMIAWFLVGGFFGAWGFKQVGYVMVIPGALLLIAIAAVPIWEDLAPHSPGPADAGF